MEDIFHFSRSLLITHRPQGNTARSRARRPSGRLPGPGVDGQGEGVRTQNSELTTQNYARRSLRLFVTTETLENDMARAAIIGLSSQPVNG